MVFVYLPPSRAIASQGVSDAVFTVSCLPLGSHLVTVFRPLLLPRRRYVVSLTVIVWSNMFFLFGSSGYFVSPFCPVTRFHRDLLISVLLSAPCGSFSEIPRLFIESRTFPAGLSPPVVSLPFPWSLLRVGWDSASLPWASPPTCAPAPSTCGLRTSFAVLPCSLRVFSDQAHDHLWFVEVLFFNDYTFHF